uniref:U85-Liphistoxin-Lth1a_1 n=1 Tax=Liphistius thaleban TaxID=1905330 RepID=A0A4Q8K1V8_9ARAC
MWLKWILVVCLTSVILGDDDNKPLDTEKESKDPAEEIPYVTPRPTGNFYLAEHFDDREEFNNKWIVSEAKKDGAEDTVAKYDGKWDIEEAEKSGLAGDLGLVLKSKAHHHAISSRLDKPFLFDNKQFILQYEVRFQKGQECGGAYIKLLSQDADLDLKNFHDKTPYTLMFGPDKCGNDHKLHFIFRHKNPKNGSLEEKHWKKATSVPKLDDTFKDKKPHLFTLVLDPDNKFEIFMDQKSVHKGSLLEDFNPPVNPPAEIDDPTDTKPLDWDEREKIPDPDSKRPEDWDEDAPRQINDPNAQKPEGWLDNEPELIPDPNAEKPSDWDDEMDGEWEPPLINNPKCEKVGCGEWKPPVIDNPSYKGKWRPPVIDNPNYKGKWKPRRIANPHFFEDKYPYKMTPIAAVGFELWSMVEGIMFDNVIITDDMYVADQWAAETFSLKKELADRETDNMLVRLFKYTNKHPWLWAVYVVVIGLPVVLFISFCCTTSSNTPAIIAAAKEREERKKEYAKKTDAQQPDDEKKESKEETIQEVKEEEEQEEAEKEDEEGEEETVELLEKDDTSADQDADGAGDMPRRRRPRKE